MTDVPPGRRIWRVEEATGVAGNYVRQDAVLGLLMTQPDRQRLALVGLNFRGGRSAVKVIDKTRVDLPLPPARCFLTCS